MKMVSSFYFSFFLLSQLEPLELAPINYLCLNLNGREKERESEGEERRGRRNGRRRKGGRRRKNKTKIFQCSVMFIPVLSSYLIAGKPWWLSGKESACNAEETGDAGDAGWIPGLERSPEEGNCNQLQYSCLGNSMDRGAWWTTVHGITKESDSI